MNDIRSSIGLRGFNSVFFVFFVSVSLLFSVGSLSSPFESLWFLFNIFISSSPILTKDNMLIWCWRSVGTSEEENGYRKEIYLAYSSCRSSSFIKAFILWSSIRSLSSYYCCLIYYIYLMVYLSSFSCSISAIRAWCLRCSSCSDEWRNMLRGCGNLFCNEGMILRIRICSI